MSRAVIISNGFCTDYNAYKDKFRPDDYIICADGGIKHLIALNLLPDLWIGDFDSCRLDDILSHHPQLAPVPRLVLKKDKDETDTHYSCIKAIEAGYTDIVIMFSGGGRLDHMLSNIHLLEFLYNMGATGSLVDEKNTIIICAGKIEITKKRKYLSIIPLDSEVFVSETKGLLYPMKNFSLPRQISMGVSNEIIDKTAMISLKSGSALIIESDD